MKLKVRTHSASGTHDVAAAIEPLLSAGDVLVLSGDLGGGKTAFVQGLAAAMGVIEHVTSPTFVLAQTFEGRLRLHHLDAYRLDGPFDALDLNLPELLDDRAVIAIEWGERVLSELPADYLMISFDFGRGDDPIDLRLLEIEGVGASWLARAKALEMALRASGHDI